MKQRLEKIIGDVFGRVKLSSVQQVAGGDIHNSFLVNYYGHHDQKHSVFCKVNSLSLKDVLHSEFQSLGFFATQRGLNYPEPIDFICDEKYAYLIMSAHLIVSLEPGNCYLAGAALAQQHKINNQKFGWHVDNFIGLSPQQNNFCSDWPEFFTSRRISPQVKAAAANDINPILLSKLRASHSYLELVLAERNIQPALLHGDLWSGNLGFDCQQNRAIFYDPAPYFGDPEVDIAMTQLFASLDSRFYRSYYEQANFKPANEKIRATYNLYHALNHFNLFGHNYQSLVEQQLNLTGFVS